MYDKVSTSSAEGSKMKVKKKLFERILFYEVYLIWYIFEWLIYQIYHHIFVLTWKDWSLVIFVTVDTAEQTDVSVHAKDIDAAHPFLWDNAWTKMQFISFSFDYVIVVSSNGSQTLDENLLIDRTGHDRRFIEVNIRLIEENIEIMRLDIESTVTKCFNLFFFSESDPRGDTIKKISSKSIYGRSSKEFFTRWWKVWFC